MLMPSTWEQHACGWLAIGLYMAWGWLRRRGLKPRWPDALIGTRCGRHQDAHRQGLKAQMRTHGRNRKGRRRAVAPPASCTFPLDPYAASSDNGTMTSRTKSEQLFAEALKYIPGGVNSPVRAFRAVGGQPFFVNKAKGARVWDVDGNEYVDYVGTWGPAILGHAHPKIIQAVQAAAENGTSFGIPNPFEVTMAKLICAWVPSVQKVRMCNSGTEACMSRHPPGARFHQARQDHQVRRLLSRACRFAAGQGRLRRADVRPPGQRRCARGIYAAHDCAAVSTIRKP